MFVCLLVFGTADMFCVVCVCLYLALQIWLMWYVFACIWHCRFDLCGMCLLVSGTADLTCVVCVCLYLALQFWLVWYVFACIWHCSFDLCGLCLLVIWHCRFDLCGLCLLVSGIADLTCVVCVCLYLALQIWLVWFVFACIWHCRFDLCGTWDPSTPPLKTVCELNINELCFCAVSVLSLDFLLFVCACVWWWWWGGGGVHAWASLCVCWGVGGGGGRLSWALLFYNKSWLFTVMLYEPVDTWLS